MILYSTFQRACAKLYVVALLGHHILCLVANLHLVAYSLNAREQSIKFSVDDLTYGIDIQLVEGDNLVEAVEEFG